MRQLMMIPVCALGLVACRAQYIMSTGDGKMITPDSKPKRDEGTGIYRYDDTEGVGGDDQEG
ncbi:YgdI/YgdR family lipoprotein [Aeromonas popoffii]|uniref:YgdI/YgdR family lipoprotein n=1 Tax=Aeromonas popoffii TaxID=70856 RepID=UPI0030D87B2F